MALSDFIDQHGERILEEWETFARGLFHGEGDATVLRDHAAQILAEVTADMRARGAGPELEGALGPASSAGAAPGHAAAAHAKLRLESGLRLDQLVGEYVALRASVLRLWLHSDEPHDAGEAAVFDHAIDTALMEAAACFMSVLEQRRAVFLGVLGHDLRNPLHSIAMGATVLASGRAADVPALGERTLNSVKRMDRLLTDLLDLARGRAGSGLPITPAPMDLGRVAGIAVDELRAAHPGAMLSVETKGDLRGEWDEQRLAQVISNLVANALQHGAAGAPIRVSVQEEPSGEVVLKVHNDGSAIPPHAIATIFQPMTSQRRAEGQRSEHAGLGLYIVDQIVKAHGARIAVTSSEGEGTCFTVRLPRHAAGTEVGRAA